MVTLHYAKANALVPSSFVVDVDACLPGRELRWSGPNNASKRAIRASHWFKLRADGDGTLLEFAGPLARLLWAALRPIVVDNHQAVNAALQARCVALTAPR